MYKDYNGKAWPGTIKNPKRIVTRYVGQLYEEEDPGTDGQLRKTKYIYLGSTRIAAVSGGDMSYYHTDHLGGTNVLTDKTGLPKQLTEYDPFGLIIKSEDYGNPSAALWHYFTGKPLDDETGLMYYGARYYNPKLGRFITPDTIVQSPGNPQTLNRYTYCNNNPVNLIDPSGHSWKKFWKKFGDFVHPLGRAIVTGEWGHFGQQVLNLVTIAVGASTGNPFLIASGALSYFNTATDSFQGGGWGTAHKVMSYTAIALAVGGAFYNPNVIAQGDGGPTIDLEKIVITKSSSQSSAASMNSVYAAEAGKEAVTSAVASSAAGGWKTAAALSVAAVSTAALFVGKAAGIIPQARMAGAAFGAVSGGVGGFLSGASSAQLSGHNPFFGGIKGATAGATFGAIIGYINPTSGFAYIGGFSSFGGQALGNVLNGHSAFSHISYGAVAGATIGGKFAPAIERMLGQNMSSAFGNGLVSGITEANGELIGKGLGER